MLPVRNVLKQEDAVSPLVSDFALEYAIRRVQLNHDGLKLNGTLQILVFSYDNILGGSEYTIKENAEALVVASKEIGLEVNGGKTKLNGHVSRSECRTKSQYEG